MDFQPTAQPLVAEGGAGFGWSRRARLDLGLGRAGGTAQGALQVRPCKLDRRLLVCAVLRTRQDRDWASCPTRPRHASGPCGSRPCAAPPARPLTQSGGSARHGKKKEEQEQKTKAAFRVDAGWTNPLPHFDPRDLIHAWRGSTVSSKVDTHQPSPGNCRRRGGVGWRGVRGMDAAAKPPGMGLRRPRHPTPPRLPTEHPRAALALDLPASGRHYRGCRVQPCKEKGRLSAASLFFTSA
ncbi:hypothetical protein FB552_3232 [Stenotrophomonas maltophilia]|jgi:hypothetical protein|nr:hypothetical protein FB552_3232 [Stenotrophomonas maltophilia]